ncbi:HAD family phosphatase [Acidiferrimicrobium sp. IK]|uniref:HAD family hydrolase n=1 Tax=Acidiferrimicrobium sp. IK TaxID=2871700 RepID=UPI0021CB58CC|nr:HAD family phosphatase [Acidiferrimicrobium sp. IK]MCU4186157.1 HAD family phosphatase [Acidiferrimicrobium sp. IK]
MTWLLCDYGEVLCHPQPDSSVATLARLCGMESGDFEEAYWRHRPAYDRGDLTAEEYWTSLIGESPGERLPRLIEVDVEGWLRPNRPSLDGVARAAARGLKLAILSNAPLEVATAIDAQPWLAQFAPRIFSYDIRAVKPDPAAYAFALERLAAQPHEVIFVDDRPANVAAAREAGMRAEVFREPAQWDTL